MDRKSFRIKLCWGLESGECPNVLHWDPDLKSDLERVIDNSSWPACLNAKLDRTIKPLDQFAISVSGCPNGCSRPQIADLGLLQAEFPSVDRPTCTGCGECARVCREGALCVQHEVADIDPELCLSCGHCIRACPEEAITPVQQGYRVQVGGKLGRHPRLADELPGIKDREQVIAILNSCLHKLSTHYQPGLRFGQIVAEQGTQDIHQPGESSYATQY